MKVTTTFEGKKITKMLPESWHEVTFRQFIDLSRLGNDEVKIIAYLMGLDYEVLKNAQVRNFHAVVRSISFIINDREFTPVLPSEVRGYKIPPNLEDEIIARYVDLDGILKKVKSQEGLQGKELQERTLENISLYPLMVATYAVTPYDFREAERLQDYFFDAPCPEVLAIGNFTCLKFAASKGLIPPPSPPQRVTLATRLMQGLRNWRTDLASFTSLYSWKFRQGRIARSFWSGRLGSSNGI